MNVINVHGEKVKTGTDILEITCKTVGARSVHLRTLSKVAFFELFKIKESISLSYY